MPSQQRCPPPAWEDVGDSASLLGPQHLPLRAPRTGSMAAPSPRVSQRFEVLQGHRGSREGESGRGGGSPVPGPVFCLSVQSAWFKGSCNLSKVSLTPGTLTLPAKLLSHTLFTSDG